MKPGSKNSIPFWYNINIHRDSKCWMIATILQASVTAGLLALDEFSKGCFWERQAHILVLIAIVATWGLALRTIRARLLELFVHWRCYSEGLIKRASESGFHHISSKLTDAQEHYIKMTIWKLRIIAAGLTLPFFVMPLVLSVIAVAISLGFVQANPKDPWAMFALFTSVGSFIVAGYFHWIIAPKLTPIRIEAKARRFFPRRMRPNKK